MAPWTAALTAPVPGWGGLGVKYVSRALENGFPPRWLQGEVGFARAATRSLLCNDNAARSAHGRVVGDAYPDGVPRGKSRISHRFCLLNPRPNRPAGPGVKAVMAISRSVSRPVGSAIVLRPAYGGASRRCGTFICSRIKRASGLPAPARQSVRVARRHRPTEQ